MDCQHTDRRPPKSSGSAGPRPVRARRFTVDPARGGDEGRCPMAAAHADSRRPGSRAAACRSVIDATFRCAVDFEILATAVSSRTVRLCGRGARDQHASSTRRSTACPRRLPNAKEQEAQTLHIERGEKVQAAIVIDVRSARGVAAKPRRRRFNAARTRQPSRARARAPRRSSGRRDAPADSVWTHAAARTTENQSETFRLHQQSCTYANGRVS